MAVEGEGAPGNVAAAARKGFAGEYGGLFDRVDGLIAVSFMAALLAGLSVL